MDQENVDILVVGGGAAGLTAAALFGAEGFRTLVVDREAPVPADDPAADPRTAALLTPSVAVLEDAGVWERVVPEATALAAMRVVDEGDDRIGRIVTEFDALEIEQGAFGWNVANADLRAALVARLSELPTVELAAPAALAALAIRDDGVRGALRMADGGLRGVRASVVVGADGRDSQVRRAMGVGARRHAYAQRAFVFLVAHDRPHGNVSIEIYRTGGPFTLVPFKSERFAEFRSSVVWMAPTSEAARLEALDDPAFAEEANARSLGVLGSLRLASPRASWPMLSLLADRFHAPRAAVIAEAAHVVPPIGAQGLNTSIKDAAALRDILRDARTEGRDIGDPSVLSQLTRRRWPDAAARVAGTAAMNVASIGAAAPVRAMRRLGLQALGRIKPLRSLAMRAGLGG